MIWGGAVVRGIQQRALSKNQAEEANAINPVDVSYTTSPYAQQQLSLAQNAMNARMPGSAQAEANAYRNQSNSFMNLSRAAGSPQALMQAAGALQGATNNSLNQLAVQEAQYKNQMMGNLNNALSNMTNERDKVYQDNLRKYNRDFNLKQGLLNSAEQNAANASQSINGAVSSIANTVLNVVGGGMLGGVPNNSSGGAANLSGLMGSGGATNGGLSDNQLLQGGYAQPYNNFNAGASSWFTPIRRP